MLKVGSSFLRKDVSEWSDDDNYVKCKAICENLKVVNDVGERGVSLMLQYDPLLTKNEQQKQYVLIGVHKHRKDVPNAKKNTVIQYLKNK